MLRLNILLDVRKLSVIIITMRKKIYHERFDIRLPKDLYNASKKYAVSEGLTLSQLIRNLLKDAIRIDSITKTMK